MSEGPLSKLARDGAQLAEKWGGVGRCKDCKHWERNDPKSFDPTDWGLCERHELAPRAFDGDLAFIAYHDEYTGAHFETHETFGCVQFENR